MARDPAAGLRLIPLPVHPWVLILGGLGLTLISWLAGAVPATPAGVRVALALAGVGLAVAGVGFRLREGQWLPFDRIESAAMLATAGMAALVSWLNMEPTWTSGKTLFAAVFVASLVGVPLVLLPAVGRKIVLSLFILFHFGGMVTAITSVDPPGGSGPWLSKQLWSYVYRPYLTFLYLTNAYHFYSPDPGPPSLLWFSVTYEDGSRTWVKVPNRKKSIGMQYQRNLALPEHSFSPMARLPYSNVELLALAQQAERDKTKYVPPPRGSWEAIMRVRAEGSTRLYPATIEENGKTIEKALPIPNVYGMHETVQYREPQDLSKVLIASVSKRIFLTAPKKYDEDGNEIPVKSVKTYRVVHQILTPQELAEGKSPWDRTGYWAYFLGEFDGEGQQLAANDPFLYWYLPIGNVPGEYSKHVQAPNAPGPTIQFGFAASPSTIVLDAVEMHAAGEIKPKKKKGK